MAEEIKKLYAGISASQMLEGTQTILDLFAADVAAFTAFDARLTLVYRAEAQSNIDAAINFPTDETVLNEITELTNDVKVAWDACCNYFQDAKYFIESAFPNNVARHNVFGFNDYLQMRRQQNEVLPFMNQFSDTAVKYSAQLIAVGYSQAKIDAIATVASAFGAAIRVQASAKKNRLETTQNRTELMNLVWSLIKNINLVSKSIYRGNYAKLQQYLMPAPASNEPHNALALSGTIINTVTNKPEAGVQVSLPALGLVTMSDNLGRYGFAAGTPAGATDIQGHKIGFAPYNSTVTLIADTSVTKNFQLTPE